MGVKDANDAIAKGATTSYDNLIHYHAMKKSGDPRIMNHTYGSFTDAKQNGEFEAYDIM